MVLFPGGLPPPLQLGGLVSICPPQVPRASCLSPLTFQWPWGQQPDQKVQFLPIITVHICTATQHQHSRELPHHPLWSVSRLRDRPQAGARVLRFLPVKVCPWGGSDWLGKPGTLSFGVLFEPDPYNLSSSYLFVLC